MNKGKISKLEDKVKKATNSGEWEFIHKVGDKPYTYNNEEFNTVEEIQKKYNLPDKRCMIVRMIIGKEGKA